MCQHLFLFIAKWESITCLSICKFLATRITSFWRSNESCYDRHVYAYIIFVGIFLSIYILKCVFMYTICIYNIHILYIYKMYMCVCILHLIPWKISCFSKCHNYKLYWSHENSQKRAMPARFSKNEKSALIHFSLLNSLPGFSLSLFCVQKQI